MRSEDHNDEGGEKTGHPSKVMPIAPSRHGNFTYLCARRQVCASAPTEMAAAAYGGRGSGRSGLARHLRRARRDVCITPKKRGSSG